LTRAPRIKSILDITRQSWAKLVDIVCTPPYRPISPIKKSKIAITSVTDFGACVFIKREGENNVINFWLQYDQVISFCLTFVTRVTRILTILSKDSIKRLISYTCIPGFDNFVNKR